MPTVQGTDDFNHAIDTSFYDAVFGTPASVLSPLYQSQPRSLKIVSAGSNQGVRKNLTGSPVRGWAAFPFRTPAKTSGQVITLANFSANAGASIGRVQLGSVGLFASLNGVSAAELAINAGTWYWVETIFDVSGTTHAVYLRVGGVDAATASLAGLSAGSAQFHQLLVAPTSETGLEEYYGLWKWGSAASISDWLGEPSPGVFVSADFRLPYEIEGPAIADTLGELPTTTLVQTVYADKGRPPTASDDVLAGHGPGDVWIHAATAWWCTSAAAGAAQWKQVT